MPMLTCPQCGQAAAEGTRFCERCGQGLIASTPQSDAPALVPLKLGATLKGGFEIIELLSQTSLENRYRIVREQAGAKVTCQLRERTGPEPDRAAALAAEPTLVAAGNGGPSAPPPENVTVDEDPAGPRAKTAELKPVAAADPGIQTIEQSAPALADGEAAAPVLLLTDAEALGAETTVAQPAPPPTEPETATIGEDLGEVFGRVLALSTTLKHAAFQRALEGFSAAGRVYLVYPDEPFRPLAERAGGIRMSESEAINVAIQLCQAVGFLHRKALRLNDICPSSVGYGADGRLKVTGLESVSNDNELQAEPIFNDGYTAPEIYRARKVDKRADLFSIGALLYSCLTGERLESESWREEAGAVGFYPPHVVTPGLEQVVRRALVFSPEGRWPNVDAMKAELVKLASVIRLRAAALTDVGMVRELNEDIVMTVEYYRDSQVEPAERYLYVVCDGMGGAEAGEIAAAIAVTTIRNYIDTSIDSAAGAEPGPMLRMALEEANSKIIEYQGTHPEARGMGSTAVGLLIVPPRAAVAWVGDSRAYILDNGELRQLTKDHSLVQRLVEIGQISAEEARHHEHKNVITRSLGARASGPAGAEAMELRLKRGDRLMLCSDGLGAHVDDAQIGEVLRRNAEPLAATRELVVAANAGGGTDNVSVIVVFAD
ncbi:MAG TPA: Stp1/IreP family PP2C-type Ser/Thr phosphatase [Candidatus Binataceae bacterium]|nr:Stp1/IreP family PP2C-type Ser/Thr phosphatase [Candidatus Binataceae bacterium]